MKLKWERLEPGVYVAMYEKKDFTIVREPDRQWHVHLKRDMPPGEAQGKTLQEAREKAETLL